MCPLFAYPEQPREAPWQYEADVDTATISSPEALGLSDKSGTRTLKREREEIWTLTGERRNTVGVPQTQTIEEAAQTDGVLDTNLEGGEEPETDPSDPLVAAARQRVNLLAKRFAGRSLSYDDSARLAILTERVSLLAPSISSETEVAINAIEAELKASAARVANLLEDL